MKMTRSHAARLAGIIGAVGVLFYCVYARQFETAAAVILIAFLAYFFHLRTGGGAAAALASPSTRVVRSPIRELTKGLTCVLAAAVAVDVALRVSDVKMGVAIALTAVVVGILGFMFFLARALGARLDRRL
jgi:hypothetical protein